MSSASLQVLSRHDQFVHQRPTIATDSNSFPKPIKKIMNADPHLVKHLLAEIHRLQDQGSNDALMTLLAEWFNSGTTDPRRHAALEVARSEIEEAKRLQALIGSTHHLSITLPNGGLVRASLRIDAIEGDEIRHTIVFVTPPDPRATAGGQKSSRASSPTPSAQTSVRSCWGTGSHCHPRKPGKPRRKPRTAANARACHR